MIYNKYVQWVIKLVHKPTGISVETDSTCFRTQFQARNALFTRLRSKIQAMKNYKPDNTTRFSYVLNDEYSIDNLESIKEEA